VDSHLHNKHTETRFKPTQELTDILTAMRDGMTALVSPVFDNLNKLLYAQVHAKSWPSGPYLLPGHSYVAGTGDINQITKNKTI